MHTRADLIVFFATAYAWGWAVYISMVISHAPPAWTILATLGPTVAAVVAHRVTTGDYRVFRIYSTWPRTLVATALGVALMVVAYVVLPAVVSADNPRELHWGILVSVGVYNYSTLLGGPLFEEPGWRGYALPRLEAELGPLRATLILGFAWTGWHLPMFFYPGWTSAPLWIYFLILLGASTLLTFGTNVAQFGVLTPIAMHAAFNTSSRFLNGLFAGTQPRVPMPFELLLALCGLATAAVLVALTRGRLAYDERGAGSVDRDKPLALRRL